MGKKYIVILQETVVGEFEVEASSPREAFEKAKNNYDACIMVNEPGECQETLISISDGKGNTLIDFEEI